MMILFFIGSSAITSGMNVLLASIVSVDIMHLTL